MADLAACDAIGLYQASKEMHLKSRSVRKAGALKMADQIEQAAVALSSDADAIMDIGADTDTTIIAAFGEMVAVTPDEARRRHIPIIDTVKQAPDALTAAASRSRLNLLGDAGLTNLAMDAAVSIQAQNSLEKMLAHQMAASHKLALEFSAGAHETLAAFKADGHRRPHLSQEAVRLANASARMMNSFQTAFLTLQRVRSGGKQVVVVQHVDVREGGQAVVAGSVKTTTKARSTDTFRRGKARK